MRVVLDTGILIAALITKDTPPDRIYQAWRKRRFELVTSQWQLDEFRRVSRYPKLRKYLQPIDAGNLVNGLRHQAYVREWVEKKIRRHLARSSKRQGFGWKRWSRRWLYDTLGLFDAYRVSYRSALPKARPAHEVS